MSVKINHEIGVITISNEVIAKVAGLAASDCYGVVGMAVKNVKDGIVHLLKKDSLAKGVRVFEEEDGIKIEFHIIVEYGTNIPAIAETVSNTVKYRVEEATELKVKGISIFVEGIRVDN